MKDSKLVRQIDQMDKRERSRLLKFVRSPYFNACGTTLALLEYLVAQLDRGRPKLEREKVAAHLGLSEDAKALNDYQSNLMKLVNRFLAVEQLGEDRYTEELLALRRCEELQRGDLLANRGKRFGRRLEKDDYRDRYHHRAAYEWNSLMGYTKGHDSRAQLPQLQQMLYHLDRHWMVEKLRHACHLTANMMLMNTSYAIDLLDELLDYLGGTAGRMLLSEEQSIDCYYHMLMSLREPDEKSHYARMRFYLDEGFDKLPYTQQKEVFEFATNYCIKRIMGGQASYHGELFELYRRGIDNEIIFDKGEISEWNYKNIVTLGAGLKQFEWTEAFIEDHRDRLPANRRENAYAFNKAQFLYQVGRLDEAAKALVLVNDSDATYHRGRVLLQVRIAYEQRDTDYALNLLETFRIYLRRNSDISAEDRRSYQNYVRLTKQLVLLKDQADFLGRSGYYRKLDALREAINATDQLIARQWLLGEVKTPAEV